MDKKKKMTSYLHIWPQDAETADNSATISAAIESRDRDRKELWFRFPEAHLPCVADLADPLVTAMIFPAMRSATDIRVHGRVSASLLRNLEEFQAAWSCWRPDRYQAINVMADEEVDHTAAVSDKTITAFSGGLDSCFTTWQHTKGDCGRQKRNVKAAVMVHGFDIPLQEADVFARAAENSRAIVESVGLELIPMVCNYREFGDDWEDEHGAALVSCLSLFSKEFSTGLIAGSHVYDTLLFPWGSNPLTDPMLSSDSFSIVYDAASVSRVRKAYGISQWEGAMRLLRVCWKGQHKDRNCGRCLRCVATAFCFAAMGVAPPACLDVPSLEEGIRRLRTLRIKPVAVTRLEEIVATARQNQIQASWVSALERCAQYKKRENRRRSNKLRQQSIELLRGALGQNLYYGIKRYVKG